MKTIQGNLRELGDAGVYGATVTYSYIEIDEQVIKKITTWRGLDGKINNALGKKVVLHMNGDYLVGITREDGKTYCTEKSGLFSDIITILIAIPLSIFIIGLPFLILGLKSISAKMKANSGSELPNAIQIPRV
jgi:hypothetical protein